MGKYQYTELENEINKVLLYQQREVGNIDLVDLTSTNESIKESEIILRSLGYDIDALAEKEHKNKAVLIVPTWEQLCLEAERTIQGDIELESLFTEDEIKENSEVIKCLENEFKSIYKLDKYDIAISAVAGLVGALVDIVMVGIPQKTPEGIKGGTFANYIREYFNKVYPEDEMEKLANSKVSKVPFDAQDNRNTTEYVEGLSAYYHRLLSLGHDPVLGFVFGVLDIMNGTMTTIDKKGKVVCQIMDNYRDRKEQDIFSALAKEIFHLKSDITTSMGLPAPLMSLFNFLQIGEIGEYEQTIAEIVQGMYYEGYDFIHFCTLSVPVMITEIIVRIGYAIKRIREGYSIKDSIPVSLNQSKHPKLASMLFIGHAGATAINAGKVYFTKNPMAINYPQWLAFAKYTYGQLKYVVMQKPALKEKYMCGRITEEMNVVINEVNLSFEEITKEYIVVFE